MEVKINREIRDYKENIYFGLSLRQFIFSVLAVAMAVIIYFSLKKYLGLELTSWLCILGSFPLAGLGFIKYNGMNLEQFVIAWLKSEFLVPKELKFIGNNIYYEIMLPKIQEKIKEELKNDKNIIKFKKARKG